MNPKKKKKRTIVIDNKMLIQGYSTTMMRADNISLKQMQIFVGVIDKLQLLTRKMLNEGVKELFPQQLSFAFGDLQDGQDIRSNERVFRFNLSDFGTYDEYRTIRKAAAALTDVKVQFPVIDKDGKPYTAYQSLCKTRFGENADKSFYLIIEEDLIRTMLNLNKGYHTYELRTIKLSRSIYTLKIYQFISNWKHKGEVKIEFKKFQETMGTSKKKYRYNDFVKRVLETARLELLAMAKENQTDCYFEYSKIPDKPGEPDFLYFKIYKTEDGILNDQIRVENKRMITFEQKLAEEYNLSASQVASVRNQMKGISVESMNKFLTKLKRRMQNKTYENKEAYVYQSLLNFIKDEKIAMESELQDFQEAQKSFVEEERVAVDPVLQEQWNKVLALMQEKVSKNDFDTWFAPIVPLSYNAVDKSLELKLPNKFFYDYIEDNFLDVLSDVLTSVFGEGFMLSYKIADY